MKFTNLVLGVALVAFMASCGSKQSTETTTVSATEETTTVEATPTEEPVAEEPVKEAPKQEAKAKQETKKAETPKVDPCEAKVAAFESYASRLEAAQARKSQGPAQLKEFAALCQEAPAQREAVASCKSSDAFKTRCATALLKVNAVLSKK
ncbi:MAG: hypothetical protein HUK18_03345 [Bacteroidales bacterium]|nr:hypothetical protein [Bacteroidales bacterium]